MINYIKYIVDGKIYSLVNKGDGTWSRQEYAPRVAGNYLLTLIVCEDGQETTIDSSNSLYETYLNVIVETERVAFIEEYVPPFIGKSSVFKEIFSAENEEFDDLYAKIDKAKADMFITTASGDGITRKENFIEIIATGTLEQRRSFLLSKFQKGKKLNEAAIKNVVSTITGSDCAVKFFGSDETDNPSPGFGYLRVQVFSPDNTKDYRYADIARALGPLIPGHIKFDAVKYFSTWGDIAENFADWAAVKTAASWQTIHDYVAP